MNLRILIYSNPLVVDKVSKRFLYWKDSGFIFTKNLVSCLPAEWRYYWLIPENIKGSDQEWFRANKNVQLVPYPYSTSIHQNRYEFYGNVLKKEFPYTMDIDAVINNQPEVAANIKVWLDNQRRDHSPIFNFFHWIDCPESREFAEELGGYFWRQWDGALAAEKNYFHNTYARSLFVSMAFKYIKEPDLFRYGYFSPPATKFGGTPADIQESKKIILFNHRLNNTTNWTYFLELCDRLYQIRKDFVVWFTDDSDKAKSAIILKKPYAINQSLPENQYGGLLRKSHFAVCVHKGYSTWNMAVLDAINHGCYTLVPKNEAVYPTMFGNVDMSMYHLNDSDLVLKMATLLYRDREELSKRTVRIREEYADYFSTGYLSVIRDDIEKSITEQPDGVPAKYDEVKDFIVSRGRVEKKEFVNKFWSFHVNSNFQRIRWRLLTHGIQDDTSKDIPTYYSF